MRAVGDKEGQSRGDFVRDGDAKIPPRLITTSVSLFKHRGCYLAVGWYITTQCNTWRDRFLFWLIHHLGWCLMRLVMTMGAVHDRDKAGDSSMGVVSGILYSA